MLEEYLRQCGLRHEVMVPLPPDDHLQRRVLLWRHDGRDFSDHEVLLLSLVRPHLVPIQDGLDRRRSWHLTSLRGSANSSVWWPPS
jgi:hypothetical protein